MNRSQQNTWRVTQGKKPLKPMVEVVAHLEKYISTYMNQFEVEEYTDETFINDILYGMGVALSDDYKFAQGFSEFKKRLIKHIAKDV